MLCVGAALLVRFAPLARAAAALAAGDRRAGGARRRSASGRCSRRSGARRPTSRSPTASGSSSTRSAFGARPRRSATCSAPRMKLSLVPLAVAGAFAGLITRRPRWRPATPRGTCSSVDGTLDFPLGYRNAEAAFFAIALFPAIGLAADRELDWRLRACRARRRRRLCIDLFLLAQSRASMPAMARRAGRLRAGLAASGAGAELARRSRCCRRSRSCRPLTSLYAAADDGLAGRGRRDEPRRRRRRCSPSLAAASSARSCARYERRLPGLAQRVARLATAFVARALIAGGLLVSVVAFVAAVGDPVHWVGDRVDEFRSAGTPDLSGRVDAASPSTPARTATTPGASPSTTSPTIRCSATAAAAFTTPTCAKRETSRPRSSTTRTASSSRCSPSSASVGLGLFVVAVVAMRRSGSSARARLGPSAADLARDRARQRRLLARARLGRLVLAVPGDHRAGARPGRARPARPRSARSRARSTRRWRGWVIAGARRARDERDPALAVASATSTTPTRAGAPTSTAPTTTSTAPAQLNRAQRHRRCSPRARSRARPATASGRSTRFREAAEMRPEEWATHYLLAELQADSDPRRGPQRDPRRARAQPARRRRSRQLAERARRRPASRRGRPAAAAQARSIRPRCKRDRDRLSARAGAELRLRVADVRLHGRRARARAARRSGRRCARRRAARAPRARGARRRAARAGSDRRSGARARRSSAPGRRRGRVERDQVARGQHLGGHRRGDLDHASPAPRARTARRGRRRCGTARQTCAKRSRDSGSSSASTLAADELGAGARRASGRRRGWPRRRRSRRRRRAAPGCCRRRRSGLTVGGERLSHSLPRRSGTARPARAGRGGRRGRPRLRSRRGSARRPASSGA